MIRVQETKKALGSTVILTLILSNEPSGKKIIERLFKKINKFEERFSRFVTDSELNQFNRQAGRRMKVSGDFLDILNKCIELSDATKGLFNPFILPSLQRAGYDHSWSNDRQLPLKKSINFKDRYKHVTCHDIKINGQYCLIPNNSALDFGGIGKGYLLDKLKEDLYTLDIDNYWLSLGGDIICSGCDYDGASWSIGLADAIDEHKIIDHIIVDKSRKTAIATSGITKRKGYQINGKFWHHIIDPRTMEPAKTDILTATVVCQNGAEADVYAKSTVIAGSKNAQCLVRQWKILKCYIQLKSGQVQVLG